MAKRRVPLWQALLSWLCLLLFCLAAPLALAAGWARLTVIDPVAYARTVRGAAADPRVQDGLAQAVTTRTEATISGENPTATEAVQARVLAQAVGEASREVIASEQFLNVWETANATAHAVLFGGLAAGWGQPVVLDLSPSQGQLEAAIASLDVDFPVDFTIDAAELQIQLLDAEPADRIRRAVQQLDLAFWASLVAAALSLLFSIVLAGDRLAAVSRVSFGLAVAMLALIALMVIGQQWLASNAGDDGAQVALGAIVDAVSQGLRLAAVGLALAGLLLAGVFAGLCALRG